VVTRPFANLFCAKPYPPEHLVGGFTRTRSTHGPWPDSQTWSGPEVRIPILQFPESRTRFTQSVFSGDIRLECLGWHITDTTTHAMEDRKIPIPLPWGKRDGTEGPEHNVQAGQAIRISEVERIMFQSKKARLPRQARLEG
jgi:hypothetical protein